MLYTVGEMAKLLDVAPSTLRYYDKEGLLPFVERSEGGVRLFRESDYGTLKIIECLKTTGMQLKDIKQFIYLAMQGDSTIEERLALFRRQRVEVEKQMARLGEALDSVKFKCWFYETAQKAGTTDVPTNMSDEELPEEFREVRTRLKKI